MCIRDSPHTAGDVPLGDHHVPVLLEMAHLVVGHVVGGEDGQHPRQSQSGGGVDVQHLSLIHIYAIRAGDDIKTIQGNLGHASAAFTLDRYGHFTERMRQDSAARMEGFIKGVLGL